MAGPAQQPDPQLVPCLGLLRSRPSPGAGDSAELDPLARPAAARRGGGLGRRPGPRRAVGVPGASHRRWPRAGLRLQVAGPGAIIMMMMRARNVTRTSARRAAAAAEALAAAAAAGPSDGPSAT